MRKQLVGVCVTRQSKRRRVAYRETAVNRRDLVADRKVNGITQARLQCRTEPNP